MHEETAILLVSDFHYGKRTLDYNHVVAEARLQRLSERLERIQRIVSAEYTIREFVLVLLGDIVDGSGIYPGQTFHQSLTDPQEQVRGASTLFADFVKRQRDVWGAPTRIEAVAGNHGRVGWEQTESNNYDVALYEMLKLKAPDIPLEYGAEDDPLLRRVNIHGHPWILHHGQDIGGGYGGTSLNGIVRKSKDWLMTSLAPFEGIAIGHYHGAGHWMISRLHYMQNGTAVTNDRWGRRRIGQDAANRWWLFGASEREAVTWAYPMRIE